MRPADYIAAARVPETLKPQAFGRWEIRRVWARESGTVVGRLLFQEQVGFSSQTQLLTHTMATLHLKHGEVVMEDSQVELRKHLPIWMKAEGSVLVTGLGLGCVVRGLLASRKVREITVVEIDSQILRVVGHEFRFNPRVRLMRGDALKIDLPGKKFDFAWHDLWTDGERHLQTLHADLLARFHPQCRIQGAWQFPREFKRRMPEWVLR
jgi:spermidine synthase